MFPPSNSADVPVGRERRPSLSLPTAGLEEVLVGEKRSKKLLWRHADGIPAPPYWPLWRGSRGRILGPLWIFYSPKARHIVRLRGDIIYYAWLLLEADPDVIELCEQPFAIRIKLGGRWRSAHVDIWARMRNGRQIFILAVYRNHLLGSTQSTKTWWRLRALSVWAEHSGAALAVMPDVMIWRDPQYLSNWTHILRFLDPRYHNADLEWGQFVVRAITVRQRMALGEIESSLPQADPMSIHAAVFRLLHAGVLRADLREHRISTQTVFALA